MEKSVKKIQIWNFCSVLIDFLVMMMWFISLSSGSERLELVMLILTVLHALFIFGAYYFIKISGRTYTLPRQQKRMISGMLVISSLLFLFSALTGGNTGSTFTVLINSVLVVSYPNSRLLK